MDQLKKFLKTSGIKVNLVDLLKGINKVFFTSKTSFKTLKFFFKSAGSKTFQERCERIRNILHRNGIEGEITLSKCRKLRKRLRLKEEIDGLDTSVIIEGSDEDESSRPRRATRRATRRNYTFDDPDEPKTQLKLEMKEDASELLRKMKEFIDSDSDYENDQHDSFDPSNLVEAVIESNDSNQTFVKSEINVDSNGNDSSQALPQTQVESITDPGANNTNDTNGMASIEQTPAVIEEIEQP